jgi:hypothetical protein
MSENSSRSNADPQRAVDDSLADHISQNVGSILALAMQEGADTDQVVSALRDVGLTSGAERSEK